MPFKPVQAFPAAEPDVQVFFHGLLMLLPDADGRKCRVGVHRLSVEHRFTVDVRAKGSGLPDPPLLRLSGPLDSMGLSIAVEPENNNGVSMFVPTPEFDRLAHNDLQDFRWSIDLETLDPAQPQMVIEQSGISPSVMMENGLFFTARVTDPSKVEVRLEEIGGEAVNFNRVAGIIGSNIYLQDMERVVLRWFADGQVQQLNLPKTDSHHTVVIYIDNSPSLMMGPPHSEFVEYFKVIQNPTKRFDLTFRPLEPHPTNTDAAPCMPVVVGGGGGGH
jgi:hypothetical protein